MIKGLSTTIIYNGELNKQINACKTFQTYFSSKMYI